MLVSLNRFAPWRFDATMAEPDPSEDNATIRCRSNGANRNFWMLAIKILLLQSMLLSQKTAELPVQAPPLMRQPGSLAIGYRLLQQREALLWRCCYPNRPEI
jgi:hypothetical protein